MKMTKLFGKTSKTEGADSNIASYKFLIQAGYIRESSSGRYYLLPLGLNVHDKIVQITRKHMNKAGAQELIMPVLHPLELWQETNRTTTTGFELMKIKDRRGAEFALGGTAEEMSVDLVRKFNISYKDLPFNIYQFSTKFRDELRARGGLLRLREFVMKDAYSFSTEAQFKDEYQKMWDCYIDIFNELGLKVEVVAADNGYIGGDYSHEFISESDAGESRYFIDSSNSYAAHEDVAIAKIEDKNVQDELNNMEEVNAERGTSMNDGARFHDKPLWLQIKDVLYFDESSKRYVLAILRGDFDVNETKLGHVANAWNLRPATEQEIREDLQSEPGFISPVNFPKKGSKSGFEVIVVADNSLRTIKNAYGGANKLYKDLLNINIDRDYKPDLEADILLAQQGYKSPKGGELVEKRGIEVGNIFQLGYYYSNLMHGAEFTDEEGKRQKYYMGCYGLGIARTLAAIVEAHHDDRGIIWPQSVSPYLIYIARLGNNENVINHANKLYSDLTDAGIAVIYDDRDISPGEKFADADLMGIPYRIVVSEKTLGLGQFEVKSRSTSEVEMVDSENVIKVLAEKLNKRI